MHISETTKRVLVAVASALVVGAVVCGVWVFNSQKSVDVAKPEITASQEALPKPVKDIADGKGPFVAVDKAIDGLIKSDDITSKARDYIKTLPNGDKITQVDALGDYTAVSFVMTAKSSMTEEEAQSITDKVSNWFKSQVAEDKSWHDVWAGQEFNARVISMVKLEGDEYAKRLASTLVRLNE